MCCERWNRDQASTQAHKEWNWDITPLHLHQILTF